MGNRNRKLGRNASSNIIKIQQKTPNVQSMLKQLIDMDEDVRKMQAELLLRALDDIDEEIRAAGLDPTSFEPDFGGCGLYLAMPGGSLLDCIEAGADLNDGYAFQVPIACAVIGDVTYSVMFYILSNRDGDTCAAASSVFVARTGAGDCDSMWDNMQKAWVDVPGVSSVFAACDEDNEDMENPFVDDCCPWSDGDEDLLD